MMWSKRRSGWLLVIAACVSLGGFHILCRPLCCAAQGSAEEGLMEEIGKIDTEAAKDPSKVEEALTGQFNLQKQDIQALLDEKVSYGDIAALLATSAASGKARQDVLGLLRSGKNWGEIAGSVGAELEAVLAQVQEVNKKIGGEATAKPKRKMKFAPGT